MSPQTAVRVPYKQDAGTGGLWSGPFTSRLHLPDEDAGTGLSWRMASTWVPQSVPCSPELRLGRSLHLLQDPHLDLKTVRKANHELREVLRKSGRGGSWRKNRPKPEGLGRAALRRPGSLSGRWDEPDGTGGQKDGTRSPFGCLTRPHTGHTATESCSLHPSDRWPSSSHTELTAMATTTDTGGRTVLFDLYQGSLPFQEMAPPRPGQRTLRCGRGPCRRGGRTCGVYARAST